MDEKLNKITIDFLEMLNGMNLEDIEQIKAEWLNELADKKSKFKDYESAKCRLPRLLTQQGLTTIERVDDAG